MENKETLEIKAQKTSVVRAMGVLECTRMIEDEKGKLLCVCDNINRLIGFLNQQSFFLEAMEDLYLGIDVSEQRGRIEESISLLKKCVDSLKMCRDSYDAINEDVKILLKKGCDIPRAF